MSWQEYLTTYNSDRDTLTCFIRGMSGSLDLTGVSSIDSPRPQSGVWEFVIPEAQSMNIMAGKYKAQFVIYPSSGRKTLGSTDLLVLPSFENLTEIETRTPDEIELEQITQAIAKLASGAVAEYEIGDRRMRYTDLDKLTRRQEYLRQRIAIANGSIRPGGRNVGTSYFS